jgi:hypothetical protein
MATERNAAGGQLSRGLIRDLPGCIKYILLLLLLALLAGEIAAGEFRRLPEGGWLIWLILLLKIILIIGLLILIWVQRKLVCEITAPDGCTDPEFDAGAGKWVVRVKGTASGAVFGSYTLAVERGGMPFPMPVIYPGGGASGTAPVVNGDLGKLDITGLQPDTYTVILTVHPAGPGSPSTCSKNFEIQHRMVYISKVGEVEARIVGAHPSDATEPLKLVKVNADPPAPDPPGPEASLADSISVVGGADVYGCGRQMSEYVLQYRQVAHPDNPWQQDAPGPWVDVNAPLPFGDPTHPRTYSLLGMMLPNYVLNGKLTRHWVQRSILQTFFPPTYLDQWVTEEQAWHTGSLNGRFTVRLRVRHQPLIGPPDPTPPEVYDAATVWLDNRQIDGKITELGISGGGALGVCDELLLSQFVTPAGKKINATINGRAWDPLILDSYPSSLRPNDNFNGYTLDFKKDGSSTWEPIASSSTRVPNVLQQSPLAPLPADTGVLHEWDIVGALDAGPGAPPPDPPYPKLYRGQRCAFLIQLYVSDTTRRGDGGTPHQDWDYFPFCIMNDLPDDLAFPVPA